MAGIDELEAEESSKPPKDEVFERMKKDFISKYTYHWSETKMPAALDELLDYIRQHR